MYRRNACNDPVSSPHAASRLWLSLSVNLSSWINVFYLQAFLRVALTLAPEWNVNQTDTAIPLQYRTRVRFNTRPHTHTMFTATSISPEQRRLFLIGAAAAAAAIALTVAAVRLTSSTPTTDSDKPLSKRQLARLSPAVRISPPLPKKLFYLTHKRRNDAH